MTSTIAAISTAVGEAGIGIVRLSGRNAIEIAKNVFVRAKDKAETEGENRKLLYGHIIDSDEIIDEVLIAFMKEPFTYTRENMVEIYCHGGIIPVKKILELVLRNGAQLAEPGEFTKRAFLNGRLDLPQAEAVIDIIKAKTEKSHEISMKQLEGALSSEVDRIRRILLTMMAHIEVSIDFPEEDIPEVTYDELLDSGNSVKESIEKLLRTSDRGRILRDGLKTVILGKPNVGKSSLLNAVLRENRAIVTDIPGTTRDVIEEYINIDGIPLKIIDTAGIRHTEDIVEKIGVDRAKESLEKADLIIAIFDISEELTDDDYHIIELIRDKKTIILLNKTDLPSIYKESFYSDLFSGKEVITTSLTRGIGVEQLENSIRNMFYEGDLSVDSDMVINNIRHKNLLQISMENIESALLDLANKVPLDCVEVDLKNCWENMGEITGESIGEDVLDRIFSEFCIGK
ncbi:MAG: tRNA uridine-5-carboxymethylaminomethyl(34) synthesis GTPase MnmE [Gudongella sp.]|jgi:tRNA modification GTPase|nr:tRNA uridine-5-carboxymethylaminomethyl(34) synthesis GTPase MnmE [Gudongella sp.]